MKTYKFSEKDEKAFEELLHEITQNSQIIDAVSTDMIAGLSKDILKLKGARPGDRSEVNVLEYVDHLRRMKKAFETIQERNFQVGEE